MRVGICSSWLAAFLACTAWEAYGRRVHTSNSRRLLTNTDSGKSKFLETLALLALTTNSTAAFSPYSQPLLGQKARRAAIGRARSEGIDMKLQKNEWMVRGVVVRDYTPKPKKKPTISLEEQIWSQDQKPKKEQPRKKKLRNPQRTMRRQQERHERELAGEVSDGKPRGVRRLRSLAARAELARGGARGEPPKSLWPLSVKPSSQMKDFSELPIHPEVWRAINKDYRFKSMMPVQAQAIGPAMEGRDILAKANTGTGKTFAFLIPAIERALRCPVPKGNVSVLILSPTRQLANQIVLEAKRLTQHLPKFTVEGVTGGLNINTETEIFKEEGAPTMLVATPVRLHEHFKNTHVLPCHQVQCLVLDEADRLLDHDNEDRVREIVRYLPRRSARQTMLFSATFSNGVHNLTEKNLRSEKTEVIDVSGGESDEEGVDRKPAAPAYVVPQRVVVTSMKQQIGAVIRAIREVHAVDAKVLVFLPTAWLTAVYARAYDGVGRLMAERTGEWPLLSFELHSQQTQRTRTMVSDEFMEATEGVMFASDVAARGMDYPDVTHVVQVFAPRDRDQYIHRLGRTARAGKTGEGWLYLQDYESHLLKSSLLAGLPLDDLSGTLETARPDFEMDAILAEALQMVYESDNRLAARAYLSWLGLHKIGDGKRLQWTDQHLVDMANEYALKGIQCPRQPKVEERFLDKLGLYGIRGLDVNWDKRVLKSPVGLGFG